MKKLFAVFITACLLSNGFVSSGAQSSISDSADSTGTTDTSINSYSSYIADAGNFTALKQEIVISANSFFSVEGSGVRKQSGMEGKDNVICFDGSNNTVLWQFEAPSDTAFSISLNYCALESKSLTIPVSLSVDGTLPFEEADRMVLQIPWVLSGTSKKDSRGNDILPGQTKVAGWLNQSLEDSEGVYNDPFVFLFTKGKHTISLQTEGNAFALDSITFYHSRDPVDYQQYTTENQGKKDAASNSNIMIEAENPVLKSDSMIMPLYEHSNASTSPTSPTEMRLNTIGSSKWENPNQWIKWQFTVKESGYYKIGIKCRQNLKNGLSVNRRIYIDDQIPFSELKTVSFKFSPDWYTKTLGDDQPYYFYLDAGKHTITMKVVSGDYGKITEDVLNTIYDLNNIYRNIILITGTTPDTYRDYNLFESIPNLKDSLTAVKDKLEKQLASVLALGKSGSETAVLQQLIVQIKSFIENPDTIPARLDNYHTNISSLSAWILDLKTQSLEVDYLTLTGKDEKFKKTNVSVLENIKFQFMLIAGSFFSDYSAIGDFGSGESALKVWVSAGKDQAQTIKRLVDEKYSANNKKQVNISLVQTGLVEATLAGTGPDVALFVPYSTPVNLASRNALANLSDFSDFDDIKGRFSSSGLVPFMYKNSCYALPVTQNFPMLFYRKDIFEMLGIKPPATWSEFCNILPAIQGKNMNVGIPDIFSTLLYQSGGQFYNSDATATELDSEAAINAFTQWTEYYTMYGLPLTFDFFNRFRTGEMPLGIASYTFFTQLENAAPEIKNMWGMVPVPGTIAADGTANYTVGGLGEEAAVILKTTKDKDTAWDFIKWFTSTEIQTQYANDIEATLGEIARFPTANRQAFNQIPWKSTQKQLINQQWDKVAEIPQIPASYYVTRNLTNAFRRVTYYYQNPRHTLIIYNGYINKEITRKNIEMGKYFSNPS